MWDGPGTASPLTGACSGVDGFWFHSETLWEPPFFKEEMQEILVINPWAK